MAFLNSITKEDYSYLNIFVCRYRIDGAVLRATVDLGSVNLPADSAPSSAVDDEIQRPRYEGGVPAEDEKSTKTPPPVDVGEILRRWTHALQTVHKQTVRLVCTYLLYSTHRAFDTFLIPICST